MQPESITEMIMKSSPPVAVTGAHAMGLALPAVIEWGTAIYVLLLIIHRIILIYSEMKRKHNSKEENE